MKTGSILSIIAVLVAFAGFAVAVIVYLRNKNDDSDFLDGYEDIAYNAGNIDPIETPVDEKLLEEIDDLDEKATQPYAQAVDFDEKKKSKSNPVAGTLSDLDGDNINWNLEGLLNNLNKSNKEKDEQKAEQQAAHSNVDELIEQAEKFASK